MRNEEPAEFSLQMANGFTKKSVGNRIEECK